MPEMSSTTETVAPESGLRRAHAQRSGWDIAKSQRAKNTLNPMREIVDKGLFKPNPDKEVISLSIGVARMCLTSLALLFFYHVFCSIVATKVEHLGGFRLIQEAF